MTLFFADKNSGLHGVHLCTLVYLKIILLYTETFVKLKSIF